jgi:hypothetical protein
VEKGAKAGVSKLVRPDGFQADPSRRSAAMSIGGGKKCAACQRTGLLA